MFLWQTVEKFTSLDSKKSNNEKYFDDVDVTRTKKKVYNKIQ